MNNDNVDIDIEIDIEAMQKAIEVAKTQRAVECWEVIKEVLDDYNCARGVDLRWVRKSTGEFVTVADWTIVPLDE